MCKLKFFLYNVDSGDISLKALLLTAFAAWYVLYIYPFQNNGDKCSNLEPFEYLMFF